MALGASIDSRGGGGGAPLGASIDSRGGGGGAPLGASRDCLDGGGCCGGGGGTARGAPDGTGGPVIGEPARVLSS